MNTETLEFPAITASLEAASEVTETRKPDLAKVDLADVALAQFGDWRADVEDARAKFTGLVLDLANQSKVDEAKSLRHRTVNTPIAEVRKVSKALKSKLASVSKTIGAEEEAAVAAWTTVGELLTPQIDARQAELDAERAVKAQGDAFRKALHLTLIERIKGYVDQAKELPSERIGMGVSFVQGLTFGDECQEFLPQYRAAHATALASLITMRDDAKAREDAEALRMENERVAAELAAQKQALAEQAAELLRQRVAVTHAAVFAFPEPYPKHEITEAQPLQQVLKAEPAPVQADATDRGRAVNVSPRGGAMGAWQATAVAPAGEPAPKADAPIALITTGELCARMGVTANADLIRSLGFESHAQKRPGAYWAESDFEPICRAVSAFILAAPARLKQAQREAA
jgi:hypothetical protein